VLGIDRASTQMVFYLGQGAGPFLGAGAGGRADVSVAEAAEKETLDRWRKHGERRCRDGGKERAGWIVGIGEESGLDSFRDAERLSSALIDSQKGMGSFHENLEEEDTQAEPVVFLGSIDLGEVASLEFWRGVFGPTDSTAKDLAGFRINHLERIGVYKSDEGGGGHQDVLLVEITG